MPFKLLLCCSKKALKFLLKKLLFVQFFHVIGYHVIQFSLVCRQTLKTIGQVV